MERSCKKKNTHAKYQSPTNTIQKTLPKFKFLVDDRQTDRTKTINILFTRDVECFNLIFDVMYTPNYRHRSRQVPDAPH
jgi:hypothetical protein